MDSVIVAAADRVGRDFIPAQYLPEGRDEYYLRNTQSARPATAWRHLSSHEVELLVKNGNIADNWDQILVTDAFDPRLIRSTEFFGFIRIGRVQPAVLEHHDLQIPAGIVDSTIVACDIGDDVAIRNVRYLAHYIIGDRCILLNIDEMNTTNHAKFGNGILKEGEPEDVRLWLDVMNETGRRKIMPFDGMIPADAYLWAKYRDDRPLQKALAEMTQRRYDSRRGYYGSVGDQCVIKNSQIIKDVKIGSHCYIKGANKLKNLTIKSTQEEPTQIGEGVEMVNGIIGLGCHIFYGCKAVRFIMCDNSNLKYGARLLNSLLGENSTVSCCELLNNLVFPAHEQHHNNSFLIAACVMGQSNLAAGATIGSNHNSRSNDNEIQAGRGFWPGLCTSVKHSSRFASFVLLAKGDYPAELDIPLPFSLLNNDPAADRLEVMPAFWWQHNMYALARNTWKFGDRDKRKTKVQHIEFDCLAPDTVEEIFHARTLLEAWIAKASLRTEGQAPATVLGGDLARLGHQLLASSPGPAQGIEVLGENMEKSSRKVSIIKATEGYRAYGQMIHYYAVKNLLQYLEAHPQAGLASMQAELAGPRERQWVNLGSQLVALPEVDRLRAEIGTGVIATWDDVHRRYDELWQAYPLAKQRHSLASLCDLLAVSRLDPAVWAAAVDKAAEIQDTIRDQVYLSRKKDFDNPFRQATYRNLEEMTATLGRVEDDSFVQQIRAETADLRRRLQQIKGRL